MAQHAPTWQPIAQLPLIASVIDGMLEAAEEQYQTLLQARSQPHVLDDATVGRVVAVYRTQRDDLWLFEEQGRRWAAEALTPAQRRDVNHLAEQVGQLRQVLDTILSLADELRRGTIEQVLTKSDVELALDVLLRRPSGAKQ